MTTPSTQTLLRAAGIALKHITWELTEHNGEQFVVSMDEAYPSFVLADGRVPLYSDSCCLALQIALETLNWKFGRLKDGNFEARLWPDGNWISAPTKPALLLAIVESLP